MPPSVTGRSRSNARCVCIANSPSRLLNPCVLPLGTKIYVPALYDEFGDALFANFASVEQKLVARLAEWAKGEAEEEKSDQETAPKSLTEKKKKKLLDAKTWERDGRLVETATLLRQELGGELFADHNVFRHKVDAALKKLDRKLSAADLKLILQAVSWRVETAPPVVAKVHKPGKAKSGIQADPLYGMYDAEIDGKRCVVEYEPDSELRDTEQISFLEAPESGEPGGLPTAETAKAGIQAATNYVDRCHPKDPVRAGAARIGRSA